MNQRPRSQSPQPTPGCTVYRCGKMGCASLPIARHWWRKPRDVTRDSKLIDLQQVRNRLALQKSSIYAGIKQEIIPPPIKLGNASRWFDDEITELLEMLRGAREGARSTH